MKFKIRFADQIVGIFILLSLTALVAILILMGANQRWFARNYYFESRFSSANGLSVGMPITLKGFEIGKVSKISLNQGNLVDLEFYVFDTFYEKVKKNSVLELATNPLGLGGGLRFHPGLDTGSPLEESSFIPSLDQEEGKRLVEAKLVDIPVSGDAINAILGRIGPVLEGVNTTLLTINNLMDTVTGTIRGTMPGPIADIMAGAIVTVTNVNSTIDTVGSTLDSVSTSIDSTIGNVNTVVAGVNTLIGDINVEIQDLLAQIDVLMESVHTITGNLEMTTAGLTDPTGLITKLLDPKGSIATLLNDNNALFDQINKILGGVNDTIGQFREFSQYINSTSPQISGILEQGRVALDKGKDVLEGIKNNPLIKGGITETKAQPSTFQSYRDDEF